MRARCPNRIERLAREAIAVEHRCLGQFEGERTRRNFAQMQYGLQVSDEVRIDKLLRRHVDIHRDIDRRVFAAPSRELMDCLTHHPVAYWHDESRLFGNWDEITRRNV